MSSISEEFETISPHELERLVANIWESNGWKTEVTNASRDKGIDVVATKWTEKGKKKHLIQVKRYTKDNKVDSQEVRNYATLYQQEPDADKVVIVSTGGFTDPAKDLASDLDVDIVGPTALKRKYRSSGLSTGKQKKKTKQPYDNNNTKIPEELYHSHAWKMTKRAVALPVSMFGVYSVTYALRYPQPGTSEINLEVTSIVYWSMILFLVSAFIGGIIFIVYASQDKRQLAKKSEAHTLMEVIASKTSTADDEVRQVYNRWEYAVYLLAALIFTYGFYGLYYLAIRRLKYDISD